MARRNIFRKVSYVDLSEDDMDAALAVSHVPSCSSSSGSNPKSPDLVSPSVSVGSDGDDLFTTHWPVESLLGIREEPGDPSAYVYLNWKRPMFSINLAIS
jgi:hypothetical protein